MIVIRGVFIDIGRATERHLLQFLNGDGEGRGDHTSSPVCFIGRVVKVTQTIGSFFKITKNKRSDSANPGLTPLTYKKKKTTVTK